MTERRLTIHILSDSLGETADAVARAAASQFPGELFTIERLPRVSSAMQLKEQVEAHCGDHCIFFHTLAGHELQEAMEKISSEMDVCAVDILGPATRALADVSGVKPSEQAGVIRRTDSVYFERISALNFAVDHDDGRHPEGLKDADIVLIGVSRTSKTPLSMYLALKGYKVANMPLAPEMEPPKELFDIEPRRVFGLVSDPDLLSQIRRKRMADLGAYAGKYADLEVVQTELEDARSIMRRIGCMVIRVDNRAIEETAQEIIRYLES